MTVARRLHWWLMAVALVGAFLAGWTRAPARTRPALPAPAAAAPAPAATAPAPAAPAGAPRRNPPPTATPAATPAIPALTASPAADSPTGPSTSGAPLPPAPPAAVSPVPPATYTVARGDSLWSIARRFDVPVEDLTAANGLAGDRIHPGQELTIPKDGPTHHQVRPGDSAWEIARRYGVTLAALAAANPGLADLGLLSVGHQLHLPTGARWTAAAPAAAVPVIGSGAGYIWPVNGTVSSAFGPRWGRHHSGIDIAADNGAPIRAARAGNVVTAGWIPGYGKTVILRHADGTQTLYAHAAQLSVQEGEQVRQGQSIARVGSTGNSTGPHLHFEIIAGRPVDPQRYLPRSQAVKR